ncbi:MAG: flagellar hook protein FlgE [Gammaproteobacteria bacterium]
MSFQQGLSGLNGAAKSLDVIGNNIANASTVGFKGSQAQFADVYANSLNGAGGNQAGIGTKVSQIAQQFTQGNIESSNNPLDIAINGAGFFRTVNNGAVQFSRNGQFSLDKEGYMVNAQGAKLTGYMANQLGNILAGSPIPLKIDTSDLKPVATTTVSTQINLDSRSLVPTETPFNPADPTTYNKQTPIDVYDSLGNPHVMSTYYVKSSPGVWDVYVSNDGTEITNLKVAAAAHENDADPAAATTVARDAWIADSIIAPATGNAPALAAAYAAEAGNAVVAAMAALGMDPAGIDAQAVLTAATAAGQVVGTTPDQIDAAIAKAVTAPARPVGRMTFDQFGQLVQLQQNVYAADNSMTYEDRKSTGLTVDLPIFPRTGAESFLSINERFTDSTQYGSLTSEKRSTQDGYTAGNLQRFSAGADGVILGQYSNGQSHALGQIVLANFANPNGLSPLGNNAWAETSTSGVPLVGTPQSGSLGVLQSSAVENSNVDLTAELVNMITAQRVYQANAQTIKTQDSVLQTLVNLR